MFTTSDCARKFSTEREKYFLASQLEGNLVYLLVSFPALPQRVRGMGRIFKSGSRYFHDFFNVYWSKRQWKQIEGYLKVRVSWYISQKKWVILREVSGSCRLAWLLLMSQSSFIPKMTRQYRRVTAADASQQFRHQESISGCWGKWVTALTLTPVSFFPPHEWASLALLLLCGGSVFHK